MTTEHRRAVWLAAVYLLQWPVMLACSWPWSFADRIGLMILSAFGGYVVMRGVVAVKR